MISLAWYRLWIFCRGAHMYRCFHKLVRTPTLEEGRWASTACRLSKSRWTSRWWALGHELSNCLDYHSNRHRCSFSCVSLRTQPGLAPSVAKAPFRAIWRGALSSSAGSLHRQSEIQELQSDAFCWLYLKFQVYHISQVLHRSKSVLHHSIVFRYGLSVLFLETLMSHQLLVAWHSGQVHSAILTVCPRFPSSNCFHLDYFKWPLCSETRPFLRCATQSYSMFNHLERYYSKPILVVFSFESMNVPLSHHYYYFQRLALSLS